MNNERLCPSAGPVCTVSPAVVIVFPVDKEISTTTSDHLHHLQVQRGEASGGAGTEAGPPGPQGRPPLSGAHQGRPPALSQPRRHGGPPGVGGHVPLVRQVRPPPHTQRNGAKSCHGSVP